MDKYTPHYNLAEIKRQIQKGKFVVMASALNGARLLGLKAVDILHIALTLAHSDFYKSMTTYRDHRVWQDVYRPQTIVGPVYFKLLLTDRVLIISCKEL